MVWEGTDMADTATSAEIKEMRREIADLRREVDYLRRLVDGLPAGQRRPTREEQLAALDDIRQIREEILRKRGGVPLPPSAEEIALARDERAAQILGETAP
jgi:hypothetical protein